MQINFIFFLSTLNRFFKYLQSNELKITKHQFAQTETTNGNNNDEEMQLETDFYENSQQRQLQKQKCVHNQEQLINTDKYYEMQIKLDADCR